VASRLTDNRRKTDIKYYSSVVAKKVDWLWYPYVPYGRITIVQGDPGDGKTTFVLNVAALLSTGRLMPDSEAPVSIQNVIYQSTEDGLADTVKPRLNEAGANCERIAFIDDSNEPLTLDDIRIEQAIVETGARMLVLDPLQAFLGKDTDLHRANDIRPLMHKLASVAERTNCAVVIIGHMNKAVGTKSLYRSLGSIDITAAARSVLLVGRLRDEPAIRVMTQLKNNLAPEGKSIAFELDDKNGFRWIGQYDVSAVDILNGEPPIEESKLIQAQTIIQDMLQSEPCFCSQIYEICHERKIGKRTVDAAKQSLGVKSIKQADGWKWSL
jgi:RecA/RadA recombinase